MPVEPRIARNSLEVAARQFLLAADLMPPGAGTHPRLHVERSPEGVYVAVEFTIPKVGKE